jgi:glucoamylase
MCVHQIIQAGLFSVLLLVGTLFAVSAELMVKKDLDLQPFIDSESKIALNGVLANIGPSGVRVPGAESGIVVASPSRANPDCKWMVKRPLLCLRVGRILTW